MLTSTAPSPPRPMRSPGRRRPPARHSWCLLSSSVGCTRTRARLRGAGCLVPTSTWGPAPRSRSSGTSLYDPGLEELDVFGGERLVAERHSADGSRLRPVLLVVAREQRLHDPR